jgi:hypothetical protein
MNKTFTTTLRFDFRDTAEALRQISILNPVYRIIQADRGNSRLPPTASQPKNGRHPTPHHQSALDIDISRLGLIDPFGIVKKDYAQKQLITDPYIEQAINANLFWALNIDLDGR